MTTCVFGMIRNAGMSLSGNVNENLIKMYNYTCSSPGVVEYADFQRIIKENCNITESNVRMYAPFLFNQGFINQYKNGSLINIPDFFTPLGKAYIKSIILSSKIESEEAKRRAEDITKKIVALSMFNRKMKEVKEYYFDFLVFGFKYGTINLKEFNYMLYEKEVKMTENYIDAVSEKISEIRNGDIDFEFLQDRLNKQGEQVRDEFPDNTFNYTRNLLLEAGLISETDSKTYKINSENETLARLLIEEEN